MKINEIKPLVETTLSRVWQHTQSDRPFAIITASREADDFETKLQKNRALAAKIRNSGYGYFFLEGHFLEVDPETEEKIQVKEESIFIVGGEKDSTPEGNKKMKEIMVGFAQRYEQDSFITKSSDSNTIDLFNKQGNKIVNLGELNPSNFSKANSLLFQAYKTKGKSGIEGFSKLKNRGERVFYFEGIEHGVGFMGRLGGAHRK